MSFDKTTIEQRVEEKLKPLGYALVKLNIIFGKRRNKMEVIIYNGSQVTHRDCILATKAIVDDEKLNADLGENYLLEVSSPGITRKLQSIREYKVFIGRKVEFALKEVGVPAFGVIEEVTDDEHIVIRELETKEKLSTDITGIQYAKLTD